MSHALTECCASYNSGYADGLADAREAVAEAWRCPDPMNCTVEEPVCGNRREIIAAIDALREKP